MANFYFSYGAVPELRPLSRDERVRVLRMSGAAYGKTPAFRRDRWLLLLAYVVPFALGALGYRIFQDLDAALLIGVVTLLSGQSAWFHLRLVHLRPFIRQVLDGTLTEVPPYHRVERWADDPRYAIPAGILYGGWGLPLVMWITDDPHLPWWALLLLTLVIGLGFGTAMWFVNKRFKGF